MKKHYKLLILLPFVTGQAWASQYAIQLEASRSPQPEQFNSLDVHGNIYTEAANNGYIRTRLGPYGSKSRALEVLNEVHQAGFPNAIIAKHKNNVSTSPSQAITKKSANRQYDIEDFDVKTLKEWKMLTPEQQNNLVYLDGKLHVKNGDSFIPLSEITGQ